MGKHREAATHLAFARTNMIAGATPEQRAKIKKALDIVTRQVAAVRLTVEPDGADLLVDDEPIGRAPLSDEIFVEPGTRRFTAKAEGYEAHTETLLAKKGTAQSLEIRLVRAKGAMPDSGLVPNGSGSHGNGAEPVDGGEHSNTNGGVPTKTIVLIAEGAVAVVGAGIGVGFLIGKSSAFDDRDRLKKQAVTEVGVNGCSTQPSASVCTDLTDAADRAKRDGRISTVGFVVGGVGLAGFAATWFLWPDERNEPKVGFDPVRRSVILSGTF